MLLRTALFHFRTCREAAVIPTRIVSDSSKLFAIYGFGVECTTRAQLIALMRSLKVVLESLHQTFHESSCYSYT